MQQQNWSFRVIFCGSREVSIVNLTLRGVIVSLSGLLETHDRLKNEREWLAIVVENEVQMKLTIDGSASRVMGKPTFQFE
jgi:hypothetical protein